METTYECIPCNFKSNRQYDFKKHTLSSKHIKKINNTPDTKYVCEICGFESSKRYNYNKHMESKLHKKMKSTELEKNIDEIMKFKDNKICELYENQIEKIQKEADKKVKEADKKVNDANAKLEKLQQQIFQTNDKIIDTCKSNADASKINAKTTKKIVNMMTYAKANFADAPPLQKFEKEDLENLLVKPNSKYSVFDHLTFQLVHGILHKCIVRIIAAKYKKQNPKEQSVWTTDVSRLNFIMKGIVANTDISDWIPDKCGAYFTKLIITPIIDGIGAMMDDRLVELAELKNSGEYKNTMTEMEWFKSVKEADEILQKINTGKLKDEILEDVSEVFLFDSSELMGEVYKQEGLKNKKATTKELRSILTNKRMNLTGRQIGILQCINSMRRKNVKLNEDGMVVLIRKDKNDKLVDPDSIAYEYVDMSETHCDTVSPSDSDKSDKNAKHKNKTKSLKKKANKNTNESDSESDEKPKKKTKSAKKNNDKYNKKYESSQDSESPCKPVKKSSAKKMPIKKYESDTTCSSSD